ncbi:MAG: nodulation protein NfeD [Actinobacteria bacterium]|nr:nodulation protein NfeD [Actinomycetota bacterium]
MKLRASLVLLLALGAFSGPALASDHGPPMIELNLDGVVDPLIASYVTSGIDAANDEGAAILITIDTPGGLDSSMRDIIQSILNSEQPVICYVSPQGARAASAGTFILTACHVAAMAPGTNVGAAHPVGVSGVIEREKVLNDAVAYIRGLAEQRDRNPDWVEDAVRRAESVSAEEALELGAIDLIAPNKASLLDEVDGRTVETPSGDVTIASGDASITQRDMGLASRFLHSLFTSNLSFILFWAGLILLFIEISNPGVSVPGIAGALCLIAALAGFGMLPVQGAGIALLLVSVVFFIIELNTPGTGLPAVGGVIALVAGGLLLFDPATPGASVSWAAIIPVAGISALFFALVIPTALRQRHVPSKMAQDRVTGQNGVVKKAIDPLGVVQVAGEEWSARSASGDPLPEGERIVVTAAEGLYLLVAPRGTDVTDTGSLSTTGETT